MINLVVALDCEAKPLIDHYGLKRQQQHALPIYSSGDMQLIVSGVGKLNSATATAYLAGMTNQASAWINIGIAGHKCHTLGSVFIAHKITEHTMEKNWYPALTFKPDIATETVCTFDTPITEYHDELLHDMEAAGFYPTASRFNTVEFVQCLKVVSDNAQSSTHNINKQMVSDHISENIMPISEFINKLDRQLNDWSLITTTPENYDEIVKKWHFSTYQQHQLKQLLKRWSTLYHDKNSLNTGLSALKSGRDVLHYLQHALDIRGGV